MKLLFDQNISFKIVSKIRDIFPDAKQVRDVNLENASDTSIWDFAKKEKYCVVTFDSDFYDLSLVRGFPPMSALSTVSILISFKGGNFKFTAIYRITDRRIFVSGNSPSPASRKANSSACAEKFCEDNAYRKSEP